MYKVFRKYIKSIVLLMGHFFYAPLFFIKKNLISGQKFQLRVLTYHNIPINQRNRFDRQLEILSREWKFIDPNTFEDLINQKIKLKCNSLLVTFDDGFMSGFDVMDILEKHSIKAIFFVISDYVLCKNDDWRRFLISNIQPDTRFEEIEIGCRNMGMNELSLLIERGHKIGAHTKTHKNLGPVKSIEILTEEIVHSALKLEELLGVKIQHFAITFGRLSNFNMAAMKVAKSKYSYIHTGIRGGNQSGKNDGLILRDSLNAEDSNYVCSALLSGIVDVIYEKELKNFKKWTN